jgi:hypothetical protein
MENNKTLAYGLLGLGAAIGIYALVGGSTSTTGTTPYSVPPGATVNYNGQNYQNNTGAPVWATATGMIMNAAGDLMGNITDLLAALNQNNNSGTPGGAGGGVGGKIGAPGYYYNPLPGGLM